MSITFLTLLLACSEVVKLQETCVGEHGEICCEGYRLDAVTFKCVKCDVGYWGSNCEIRCPFPTYGDACQQLCDCEERRCNSAHGISFL
ncbi:multiple epidermal growth factor-like domains protein 10 isoform X4 [Ostrea edulis]|uniref:multiple epidermal growth factor-like domains protein 10 isoform X4 n=1 Tax=Ostrea edulis TaxID=37623 RepID=UPI0024AF1AB5|nr:multiple epidermal growth factor-like domains protein 10 isoform X4 [Ostrea edulis]